MKVFLWSDDDDNFDDETLTSTSIRADNTPAIGGHRCACGRIDLSFIKHETACHT